MMRNLVLSLGLVALAGAPLATGCATVSRGAADVLLPVEDEVKLGNELRAELEKELTISTNQDAINYVKNIGDKIAARAKSRTPAGITISFKVIEDDNTVNAFATPGGTIYVYTGLLKTADNSAEVAAVMGHEVAHVTNRHVAQRLVAANGLAAVTQMALGKDPGLLGQIVGAVVNGGAMLKYGRDQERESDQHGVTFTNSAGWDPMGFVTFFEKLKSGAPEWTAIFTSHPAPEERMRDIEQRVKGLRNRSTNLDAEAHAALKAKL